MNLSLNTTQQPCHFCSQVSQANGEDPIGSAIVVEHYLIIEAPQPWKTNIWIESDPMPQGVLEALNFVWDKGDNIRQLAIAPDREYSYPNYTRVLYYSRPAKAFAQFEKQEFIVPHALLGSLALALLKDLEELPKFNQYRQQTNHIRELLVCTHGNVDAACSRFGYPIYKKLRTAYAGTAQNSSIHLLSCPSAPLRVWRCSHFGGHQFAPTLVDLPLGQYWGHLQPNVLDALVERKGNLRELYPYYRGWGGLSKFEQIAEREIWMQEGWNWLDYEKSGQVMAIDPSDSQYPNWAKVRIDFNSASGEVSGSYEARIDTKGTIKTMKASGKDESLCEVKQYWVSQLAKLPSAAKNSV